MIKALSFASNIAPRQRPDPASRSAKLGLGPITHHSENGLGSDAIVQSLPQNGVHVYNPAECRCSPESVNGLFGGRQNA
jgi:hypothetical protein